MMTGLAGAFLLAVLSAGGQPPAGLDAARDLYVAADYEAALAAFDRLADDDANETTLEIDRYRALCLIALGRAAEADRVIEQLVQEHPQYEPDEQEAPRVRAAFTSARSRVLPQLARTYYIEAKTAYDKRDHRAAVPAFERALSVLESLESADPALGDLRTLASGFLDLSRAALAPTSAPAAPAATPAVATGTRTDAPPPEADENGGPGTPVGTVGANATRAADAAPVDAPSGPTNAPAAADPDAAVPPVAIQQELPQWAPPSFGAQFQSEFRGAVEVTIDDKGEVTDAKIVEAIHPAYDPQLLQAASQWRYQPARRGNRPVASTKRVEVVLRPRN